MKATTALLLLATAATAAARIPLAGDFDGDGSEDAALYDEASARLEVGYGVDAPGPEWRAVDVRRHAYFDGRFLRAADLNADGRTDLYVASRDANRVLVLWGEADRSVGFTPDEITPGHGPAFADLVPGTDSLATPLLASATPAWYRFLPETPALNPVDVPIGPSFADADWTDFRAGRQTLGAVINAAAFAAARSASDRLIVFQKRPLSALSQASAALPGGLDQLTAFGFFGNIGDPPATVAFGEGESQIVVAEVLAGAGANPPVLTTHIHNVGAIAGARTVGTASGDRLLLVSADGSSATLNEIDGANLNLEQTINPPAGESFLTLAHSESGALVAALASGGFAIYTDDGGGYALLEDGPAPVPPAPSSGTQIVLYDAHPYGGTPALPIEKLPAGDWASAPSLAGNTISATLERLLDPMAGLGNPSPVSLDASVPVPPSSLPVANQWQADTAIKFDEGPSSDGAAAVVVSPAGGNFASTVELSFLAAPGTTVHYRLGDAAWQTITPSATVAVNESAHFEYFGSNGTALSAIRAEDYLITQDPDADTDGDDVPDPIELAFGLSPFGGSDSDGDGSSDFDEIVQGTDPGDPNDSPTEEVAFDFTRIEVTIDGVRDNGTEAPPAIGTEVFVRSLDGALLATATTDQLAPPHAVIELESTPRFVVVETPEVFFLGGFVLQPWPQGRRLSAVVELTPEDPPVGPVDPGSPTMVADWLAAVENELLLKKAKTAEAGLNVASSLHALLFEAWMNRWKLDSLDGKGTDLVGEPRPGVVTLVSDEVIAALEAVEPDGDRFDLDDVFETIGTSLADASAAALIAAATDAYATSAGSDPEGSPPVQPLRALRGFLDDGTVPAAYVADLAPAAALSAIADTVIDSPMPDDTVDTTGLLELNGTDCLVLVEANKAGTRYELVDADGLPFWQTEAAPLIAGATAALTAFVLPDATPTCGDVVVEVVSLEVTDVPPAPVNDENMNDLPDDVENLLLGELGGGFWDDFDGDGYANGEELLLDPLNPSDPADNASVPAGPPAIPANTESPPGENFVLEWDGNGAANYSVECALGLDGAWAPTGIPPVEEPPGHFTWSDPDPIDDEVRKFYRIIVILEP